MIFRRPRMESDRRKSPRDILLAGFALCYGIYFVRLMLFGLKSWFSGDDLLNLHYVWSRPVSDLLRGNIFFFNHYQRPMGEAFLYLLYLVFGFNPGPYNVVRLLLCVCRMCASSISPLKDSRDRAKSRYLRSCWPDSILS